MSCVTAADYLKRMRYTGSTEPTVETLKALAMCHLAWVPFENMDMLAQLPLNLSKEFLWDKIVTRGRGGICHELNNSFAFLLWEMGFHVTLHTANVDVPGDKTEHTNMRVVIDGETWLVDVGFGAHTLMPLNMETEEPQEGYGYRYKLRLEEDGSHTLLRENRNTKVYEQLYIAYPEVRQSEDVLPSYRPMALPNATRFSRYYVVVRVTPTAKYTLVDETLSIVEGGERTTVNAPDESTRRAMLVTYFGIHLD